MSAADFLNFPLYMVTRNGAPAALEVNGTLACILYDNKDTASQALQGAADAELSFGVVSDPTELQHFLSMLVARGVTSVGLNAPITPAASSLTSIEDLIAALASYEEEVDGSESWMMEVCDLFGQLGMIICWYWDGPDEQETGYRDAIRAVSLIPKLLSGDTEKFRGNDWWIFYDALGMYPHRTPVMDEIYDLASERFHKGARAEKTRCFLEEDEDDSGDAETNGHA